MWTCSADVNGVDNFYWTPLHMAAHSGVRSVVEYLLEHGASLEAKSLTGATPVMKAIETCSLDIVQLLINRGAKVRTEDMCSKSPRLILTCHFLTGPFLMAALCNRGAIIFLPCRFFLRFVNLGEPMQISTGFASWQRYCTAL